MPCRVEWLLRVETNTIIVVAVYIYGRECCFSGCWVNEHCVCTVVVYESEIGIHTVRVAALVAKIVASQSKVVPPTVTQIIVVYHSFCLIACISKRYLLAQVAYIHTARIVDAYLPTLYGFPFELGLRAP